MRGHVFETWCRIKCLNRQLETGLSLYSAYIKLRLDLTSKAFQCTTERTYHHKKGGITLMNLYNGFLSGDS